MTRTRFQKTFVVLLAAVIISALSSGIFAQEKKPRFPQRPTVNSPEVLQDGRVVFRILAPDAGSVGLQGSDIPGLMQAAPKFTKNEEGVWETTVGPVPPGAYRYVFTVNGASVVDPRNTSISESNNNVWSMVYIPGADFMEMKNVPHGAVAEINYYSKSLKMHRRMHVYTPPGYDLGSGKYPVFYLLHGAGDCDDSWTTVGRAGFILDNLIAAKKAKPMIVVMPAGHTPAVSTGGTDGISGMVDAFSEDFVNSIMPYVEANYRVLKDRRNQAIAGLSMGGMQTLNVAMSDLGKFSYIGVFSSGVFGMAPRTPAEKEAGKPPAGETPPSWEEQHAAMLGNAELKKDLKLLWFATGSEDFLVETTKSTVEMLKKHGFSPVYKETGGGHTWANWRDYLYEFAPQLFR
ncbi:MAG: esterase [Acidobacteria bacterium]|nr:esterase [Acidobacteriota bacterium]